MQTDLISCSFSFYFLWFLPHQTSRRQFSLLLSILVITCVWKHTHTHTHFHLLSGDQLPHWPCSRWVLFGTESELTSLGHCSLCGLTSRLSFPLKWESKSRGLSEASDRHLGRTLKSAASKHACQGLGERTARAMGQQPLHLLTVVLGWNEFLLEALITLHILPGR